jgi:hypothetical protein
LDAAAAAKMSNGFDLRLEVVLRVEKKSKVGTSKTPSQTTQRQHNSQ